MNKQQRARPRTLLLGSYGRGNIGDDVFLEVATELFSDHDLYINSADDGRLPTVARGRVTTISTVSVRDLLKKIRVFLRIRAIIYWGGDVWVELYGDRWPRRSLYKMILLNALARLWGKKVYYVGCGIGKLQGLSLRLARISAKLSNGLISREQRSADVLALPSVTVLPDLAINLPYYHPRLHTLPTDRRFLVGISLLYYLPDPQQNFPRLADHIAQFVASLPADKFRVVLLPMLMSDHDIHDDAWAAQQVLKRLEESSVQCEVYQASSLREMVQKMGEMDLIIGTRLHANILATFNATPCLGIAYRAKVSSFFADNDLAGYCIGLDELEKLPDLFWDMYNHYDQVAAQFMTASERNLAQRTAYQVFATQH